MIRAKLWLFRELGGQPDRSKTYCDERTTTGRTGSDGGKLRRCADVNDVLIHVGVPVACDIIRVQSSWARSVQ
jgi:hypothetical protein